MRGQSLIELIIASAIFLIIAGGISYVVLTSFFLNRDARERIQALFIAEEGIEAARSIRDNNWNNLGEGDHGVGISGGRWIFFGTNDVIQNKFTRVVNVTLLIANKKKVTSRVTWTFRGSETRTVELVTYLTNWNTP